MIQRCAIKGYHTSGRYTGISAIILSDRHRGGVNMSWYEQARIPSSFWLLTLTAHIVGWHMKQKYKIRGEGGAGGGGRGRTSFHCPSLSIMAVLTASSSPALASVLNAACFCKWNSFSSSLSKPFFNSAEKKKSRQ